MIVNRFSHAFFICILLNGCFSMVQAQGQVLDSTKSLREKIYSQFLAAESAIVSGDKLDFQPSIDSIQIIANSSKDRLFYYGHAANLAGKFEMKWGSYAVARDSFNAAIQFYMDADTFHINRLSSINAIAIMERHQGNLRASMNHSLKVFEQVDSLPILVNSLQGDNLEAYAQVEYGNCLLELGNPEAALHAFMSAYDIRRAQEPTSQEFPHWIKNMVLTLHNIAEAHLELLHESPHELLHLDSAQIYADLAWALVEKYGLENGFEAAVVYDLKGDILLEAGRFEDEDRLDQARNYLLKAMALWNDLYQQKQKPYKRKHKDKAETWLALAKYADQAGIGDSTVQYYHNAIRQLINEFEESDPAKNPESKMLRGKRLLREALLGKANAVEKLGGRDVLALESYELAFKVNEKLIQQVHAESAKLFLSKPEMLQKAFKKAIQLAINLYRCDGNPNCPMDRKWYEKALELSERARAMVLLEEMRESSLQRLLKVKVVRKYGQAAIDASRKMKEFYNTWQGLEQRALKSGEELPEIQNRIRMAHEEYERFFADCEKQYPEYFSIVASLAPISLDTIQDKILKDKRMALVEYCLTENMLITFFITSDSVSVNTTILDDTFEKDLSLLLDEQENCSDRKNAIPDVVPAYQRMYQVLLKPQLDRFKSINRLIIVPDKKLALLSFDPLLRGDTKVASWKEVKNDLLIRDYALSYDYSATLLWERMRHHKESNSNSIAGIAPKTYEISGDLDGINSAVDFVCKKYGGTISSNSEATKRFFLTLAKRIDILIAGVHGFADDDKPNNSYLTFHGEEKLHMYELFLEKFSLNHLFLAACETGKGKQQQAEGIMSIGRAFTAAGCASVMVGLWDVIDDRKVTGTIIKHYFDKLASGVDKDLAIQSAKIAYLDESVLFPAEYQPGYWAVWAMTGDTSPVPILPEGSLFLIIIAGVLILFSITFAMRRYMRK